MTTLANNKIARFNYEILEELEGGLVLSGSETKAVKKGQISLRGAYLIYENDNLWLKNCHISPYQEKNQIGYDPLRLRKILLNRQEIDSLQGKIKVSGLTLLPLYVYTKGALIKIKIGLARGKKKYDKRATIKKREVDRKIRRALKY
jgi:SsrA-binding protein